MLRISVAAFSLLLTSMAVFAAEGPLFEVTTLSDEIIYTVDSSYSADPDFKPHANFPFMEKRADGTLRIGMNVGQAHGVRAPGKNFKSYDNGQNWSVVSSETFVVFTMLKPTGQTSHGFGIIKYDDAGYTSFTGPHYTSTNGGNSWSRITDSNFNCNGATYISMYNNKGEVVVNGGTWFVTAFGMRQGQSTHEIVLFASTDSGANWTRRASIAQYVGGDAISMGSEGANEGDIVLLNNGDLLSVFRTGQPFPSCDIFLVNPSICWSISSDNGYNWSTPKMLGTAGQQVKLAKLDDGSVVMIYGRYGGKLMFADETGRRWTQPFVIYDGPTCGTVSLAQADDGNYVFMYAESSYYNTSYDNETHDISWTPMDFSVGVEMEWRARITRSTTTQSAVSITFGDGTGVIYVELTGSGVNLQGLGGNGGQVTHSFNTAAWTTYRLTVAPDAGAGGQIRAKLYVNDVYKLGNALDPVTEMDQVRIGDVTGTNNGAWDLDWLRYRTIGDSSWSLEYEGDTLPDYLAEDWRYNNSGSGTAQIVSEFTGGGGGGVTWDITYEGDVMPTADTPSWSTSGNVAATLGSDSSDDWVTIDSQGTNSREYSLYNVIDDIQNIGVTVEFRARVYDNTTQMGGVWVGDGSIGCWANFFCDAANNNYVVSSPTGSSSRYYGVIPAPDPTQWHVYKVIAKGDKYSYYIDDNFQLMDDLTVGATTNYIRFGDSSNNSAHKAKVDYDYVRVANETESLGDLTYLTMDTGNNGAQNYLYYTLVSSSPNPPACYVYEENGEEVANMRVEILDIQRFANIEEFDWALEYHGDVTPDNLPEPWSRSQSGNGINKYLWADNGQDYLHFDTGANGTSRLLDYTLTGGSWNLMDFASGVVMEFRARVVSSTSSGAAKIILGDASNGRAAVKLTDSDIKLEGISYSLDTSDWHTYRVVIGPDAANGNNLWAKVYLDEDHTTAILATALNPETSYDEISIGDMNTTNNGVWDLDFLRFAATPCGLEAYPYGDVNRDCVVDLPDYTDMAGNWQTTGEPFFLGDLTGDGIVNVQDLSMLSDGWLDDRRP